MKASPQGLAFAALVLASTLAHAAPSGDELLRAMRSSQERVAYTATETTVRSGAPTVVARVQSSGGKRRIEYLAPAIMKGDLLIDDGQTLWRYHRAEKSAVKTRTPAKSDAPQPAAKRGHFAVSNQGRSTFAGRKAWVVALTSRSSQRVVRKIWIDEWTKIRLRSQGFDSNGKVQETTSLTNLKFGSVPASAFRWSPPSGTKISNAGTLYMRLSQAQRKADWVRAPTKLPRGYAFESVVVNTDDAWMRYSNGVRRFSIFQKRTADMSSKSLSPAGSGWYWQKGGSRFVLAGLPKTQAQQVATSVR